eukprot:TRINITY_DN779863_c0_g1_i1.p1 TRINITY_DN779863_c0_g1~~TRINITY_DN779863_c0_g1_i1.p1  ORF type:complete len:332 (+),score=71.75 TRINITY_DN779863_c0_g1_i1:63-1058(+)
MMLDPSVPIELNYSSVLPVLKKRGKVKKNFSCDPDSILQSLLIGSEPKLESLSLGECSVVLEDLIAVRLPYRAKSIESSLPIVRGLERKLGNIRKQLQSSKESQKQLYNKYGLDFNTVDDSNVECIMEGKIDEMRSNMDSLLNLEERTEVHEAANRFKEFVGEEVNQLVLDCSSRKSIVDGLLVLSSFLNERQRALNTKSPFLDIHHEVTGASYCDISIVEEDLEHVEAWLSELNSKKNIESCLMVNSERRCKYAIQRIVDSQKLVSLISDELNKTKEEYDMLQANQKSIHLSLRNMTELASNLRNHVSAKLTGTFGREFVIVGGEKAGRV